MSKVFIVLNVRDDTEPKYPSIVFLSICCYLLVAVASNVCGGCNWSWFCVSITVWQYSKTCVKRQLKNRQMKYLNDKS